MSTFGRAIAVRSGAELQPLPAGLLVEVLGAAGVELAHFASERSPSANDSFAGAVGNHVAHLLRGAGLPITGPIRTDSGGPIHSLVTVSDRQLLAIDVVAGLRPGPLQSGLDSGARALRSFQPGCEVQNPATSWTLAKNAEIVRLQIVDGPQHALPLGASGPIMSVDDFEWIMRTAQPTIEDLWYFVRDLEQPPGVGRMFSWDLIDRWEVWRPRKSFYRGGVALTSMMFAPHASSAEWDEASQSAPIERALTVLRHPPLRAWPIVSCNAQRGTEVGDLVTDSVLQILPLEVPVAVAKVDPAGPVEHRSTLWSLAEDIAWKLVHSAGAFGEASHASGLDSLRIDFEFTSRTTGPPVSLRNFDQRVLTIAWDDRLQNWLARDSYEVERACGELVAQAFGISARAAFVSAWNAAPPGIRVDGFTLDQHATDLPDPRRPHEAHRSETLRPLGEHLVEGRAEPAVLEGRDASRFESQIVFPWLRGHFHAALSKLDATELHEFAFAELECAGHERVKLDMQIGWELGFPVQGESDHAARRETNARARRAIGFMVEEIMASPPTGNASVDEFDWIRALSIADLCIDSCLRSDAIHFDLDPTAVEVTDLYEVNSITLDHRGDIDFAAYKAIRSLRSLPRPEQIEIGQHEPQTPENENPTPLVELRPDLLEIDSAMRTSLGFGLDAITGALNVARQWPVTSANPTAVVEISEVVDECVDLTVGATREEYAAALDWLTLRRSDLVSDVIPHWEIERREARIVTRPLIESGDDIRILPWTADSTMRVFGNYLFDGRLPWPEKSLPQEVRKALNRYRQARNRQHEKDCVEALQDGGFIVRGSVKPEKVNNYGLSYLSGEIDALCIDVNRSRIWVVEAKDPYTPYSSRQHRNLVDDFVKDGGYIDKLRTKTGEIAQHATSIAAALDVPRPGRRWETVGLLATRHPEPAAFAHEVRVPFCTLDDLVAVIDQTSPPPPGFVEHATVEQAGPEVV